MRNLDELITFPRGLSNFEKIVNDGDYYVDKTSYIELLEKWGDDLISFLRPRRIGKSLFVSVLQYYYGKEHKDKFNKLFGKYYIGKNPTSLANSFAVLKMDFSAIDTRSEESAYQGFLRKIKTHTAGFHKRYKIFSEDEINIIQTQPSPEGVIEKFFEYYQGDPIYFILDEYDHFTNEILIQDLKQFKKAVTKNGYVRKFYEALKLATQQGIVNKIFITGVSPVTLDSLTSGFNIITHLTNELEFHDMMGFTEEEVSQIIDLILVDKSRRNGIMADLKDWYNGYRFNLESEHQIYNANMVLHFCAHFQRYQKYPREMLDPNIAPDYGKLKKMFEIQHPAGNYELLEKVMKEEQVINTLIFQFSFEKNFSDSQFISFLYYMGYLTIAGSLGHETIFQIPNRVIQELYWEYFAYLLTEREQLPYDEDKVRPIIRELVQGRPESFFAMIEDVLKILSNRDYQDFDEKYIKMLIIAYILFAQAYYIPISEREASQEGYIDLLLLSPPNIPLEYEYFFEIKYIKKSEATDKKIAKAQNKAREQALRYLRADATLKNKAKLLAYTLVFVKNQILVEEVELE